MIKISDFIHPEDEMARRNLESIPGFSSVVKGFMQLGYEQFFHGLNMANKIRLSPTQLPEIYHRLPPICSKLGIQEPEFYLEMNPMPNAYTYGDTRIFITITSSLVEYLEEDELDSVIAHECGHIVCRHVLYHTMASFIMKGIEAFGIIGKLATPLQLAFLYWIRRSELSADRAAAAVVGSIDPVIETMIRLFGGPKSLTEKVDSDLYALQAEKYDTLKERKWDRILQSYALMWESHPFGAIRVNEIRKWGNTIVFENIASRINNRGNMTTCISCGNLSNSDWKFCKYCGNKI